MSTKRPSIAASRPSLGGSRPSISGGRPSIPGGRPSIAGNGPNMAELAGFRRYSYPALRHKQSEIQRGSLFSVQTTTQTSGYSWFHIIRAMRKQDLSLSAGLLKCIFDIDLIRFYKCLPI